MKKGLLFVTLLIPSMSVAQGSGIGTQSQSGVPDLTKVEITASDITSIIGKQSQSGVPDLIKVEITASDITSMGLGLKGFASSVPVVPRGTIPLETIYKIIPRYKNLSGYGNKNLQKVLGTVIQKVKSLGQFDQKDAAELGLVSSWLQQNLSMLSKASKGTGAQNHFKRLEKGVYQLIFAIAEVPGQDSDKAAALTYPLTLLDDPNLAAIRTKAMKMQG